MNHCTTVVTGKSIHLGGSLGQEKATGRGVFVTGREVARRLGIEIADTRIALQGYGIADGYLSSAINHNSKATTFYR